MDNELQLFRDSAQRLFRNEVLPHYDQWERAGITPRSLWILLGDNGLLCVDLPTELGGSGVPLAYSQVVIDEVGQLGMAALATNMVVHSDIVAHYVLHYGNVAQKQQWLPKMASGAAVGAIAMTEPGAGSDLQGMRTSAVRNDAGWLINGSKTFITNGQHADLVIVAAKSDPKQGGKGISLFLVDTTLPGFERGRNLEKIGLHSGDTSELFFNDLQLGADALLGELNQGLSLGEREVLLDLRSGHGVDLGGPVLAQGADHLVGGVAAHEGDRLTEPASQGQQLQGGGTDAGGGELGKDDDCGHGSSPCAWGRPVRRDRGRRGSRRAGLRRSRRR